MIVNLVLVEEGKTLHLEDSIDFSKVEYSRNIVSEIKTCNVKIDVANYGEIIHMTVNVSSDVVVKCAYSNEDVNYKVNAKEELDFSFDIDDDEEIIHLENPQIEMDELIFSMILVSIPKRVIKKGAKRPESGNGYRVLTEEELLKEKESKKDSRWDILDSIEFDD